MARLLLVLSGKNGVSRTKWPVQSATQLHWCFSSRQPLFFSTQHTLCILSISSYRIIKRHVFRGQDLITLSFLQNHQGHFLRGTGFFFSTVSRLQQRIQLLLVWCHCLFLYYRVNSFAHCCFQTINASIRVKKTMSQSLGKQFCLLGPKKGPWNLCPGVHGPYFEN